MKDLQNETMNVAQSKTATNDSITVGATSTAVLELNESRDYVIMTNDSDETIYLALGATAVMNKGIRLNASGGSYELTPLDDYKGAISAICSSGSKNLCVSYY